MLYDIFIIHYSFSIDKRRDEYSHAVKLYFLNNLLNNLY